MSDTTLSAIARENTGKGSAREARRQGFVPAVLYGGKTDAESVQIKFNEVIRLLNSGNLLSSMMNISIDGKEQQVLTKAVQFHPVSDMPVHIDFLRVTDETLIEITVPAVFVGEEDSPGIKRGGILNVVRYQLEIKCPAGQIPDSLTVDVSSLKIGDAVKISQVELPENVKRGVNRDYTIATVVSSRASKELDEGDEGTEEGTEDAAAATEE